MEQDCRPPNVENLQRFDAYNSSSNNGTSIVQLPDEILIHILQFLPFKVTLQIASRISKTFYSLSKDPKLVPKSFTVPVFRSDCLEKNKNYREQILNIVTNASLLQTLSIEVNNICRLDNELQLVGSGGCKKLKTLAFLGINETPSTDINVQNNMPMIAGETVCMLRMNCPCLSTVVLHNYICGDGGQAAANFLSHIPNLKRLNLMHCVDFDPIHLVVIAKSCAKLEKISIDFNPTDMVLKEVLLLRQDTLSDLTIADMEPGMNRVGNPNIPPLTDESFKHLSGCMYLKRILFWNRHEGPNFSFSSEGMTAVTSLPLLEKMEINAFHLHANDYLTLNRCKKLEELSLNNALHLASSGIIEILKLNNLKRLELIRANSLNASDFAKIMCSSNLVNLSDITFWDCQTLDGELFSSYFESNINNLCCRQLKTLELRYCKELNDTSVKIMIENCDRLKTLDLGGCKNLTESCMEHIVKFCKLTLETLIISSNDFSDMCLTFLNENIKNVNLHDIA